MNFSKLIWFKALSTAGKILTILFIERTKVLNYFSFLWITNSLMIKLFLQEPHCSSNHSKTGLAIK